MLRIPATNAARSQLLCKKRLALRSGSQSRVDHAPGSRLLEFDWQRLQATQAQVLAPRDGSRLRAQIGHAPQHRLERNLPFDPRQRCTETEMTRPCERD